MIVTIEITEELIHKLEDIIGNTIECGQDTCDTEELSYAIKTLIELVDNEVN